MKFHGGIHPRYQKLTATAPIRDLPLLETYVVPVGQHIGAPGELIVEKGQTVGRGQPLTKPAGFVSVPVHAPTSGAITRIAEFAHPVGLPRQAVQITADGQDTWFDGLRPLGPWRDQSPDDMRGAIRDAGIVGMGGASFPTHVKLSPPKEKPIDLLILNGAECEPYLTSDHRVMVEHAAAVAEGIGLMMRTLGVRKAVVGIESNKPDAAAALRTACPADLDIECRLLETKYPQGSEKHLIYAVTGREVPSGGLPMDAGVVVQNVGTAAACLDAVVAGRPMTERIVTVTGSAVGRPDNLRVRIGTPLEEVLAACGGLADDTGKVIFGGPMMGMVQYDRTVPVLKGTSGILCLKEDEVVQFEGGPCIRCGYCVDVCPMFLLPNSLGLFVERSRFEDLEDQHVNDCIECGSCAYVCPSHRPLVQFIKRGKLEANNLRRKREEAAAAEAGRTS